MTRELATSPDGQWIAARDGRAVDLIAFGAGSVGTFELAGDDADLAFVHGPPIVALAIVRSADATQIALYQPPELEPAARLELGAPARIATVAGGRIVLVTDDRKEMTIVRATGRGLASHPVDLADGSVDFAVGIERNQLVIGQPRKLEVWDSISGRPLRRLALDLPPPPRLIGAAAGHIWVVRPGTDEVVVYRLSDSRPFRHYVGSPIDAAVAHPLSPIVVLVTRRGLVRLHCFAHSLFAIAAPWQAGEPLAQLVHGDDISLLGWPEAAATPWSEAIGGTGAPAVADPIAQEPQAANAAEMFSAMRRASGGVQLMMTGSEPTTFVAPPPAPAPIAPAPAPIAAPIAAAPPPLPLPPPPPPPPASTFAVGAGDGSWRDALAQFASDLARGVDSELPQVGADAELHVLGRRLGLTTQASRALTVLYARYLVGAPAIAIAQLASLLGDWTEALGRGQLGALAMLDRAHGTLELAAAVTDALDGAAPREIRIAGGPPGPPHAGAWRLSRDGRSDAEVEAALVTTLERIAVVEGRLGPALLEARLHGATAVTMVAPTERPNPWPSGAGLVLVLYGAPSSWIADLPPL